MLIFLSGGAKNGKSMLAQRLCRRLSGGGPLYYLATMIPHDGEDEQRIARHVRDRAGWGFQTLEWGRALETHLAELPAGATVLLDSVTALLANEMFPGPEPDLAAPERVLRGLTALCGRAESVVFVSDFIYSDAGRYDPLTEAYRRGLAMLDRALCARCDAAAELCGGNVTVHKGVLPE